MEKSLEPRISELYFESVNSITPRILDDANRDSTLDAVLAGGFPPTPTKHTSITARKGAMFLADMCYVSDVLGKSAFQYG